MLKQYIYSTAMKFKKPNWAWLDQHETAINQAVELVQCFPNCKTRETFRYWKELCALHGFVLTY